MFVADPNMTEDKIRQRFEKYSLEKSLLMLTLKDIADLIKFLNQP